MKIIDLFCGEGGAAEGYYQAGFTPYGVDLRPQPRYPFARHDGDAVVVLARLLGGEAVAFRHPDGRIERLMLTDFVAAHASPPCQFGTELNSDRSRHLNLIPAIRALLGASALPYTIENVRGVRAHLIAPVSLFGTMFGLRCVTSTGQWFDLSRERLFETNWGLTAPFDPGPAHPIANVYGGHFRVRSKAWRTGGGTGRTVDLPGEDRQALARQLMEMPWATMTGMSEAVPPAFTRHIGQRLAAYVLSLQSKAA